MAGCLSGGPRLLPSTSSVATVQHLWAVSVQPILVFSLSLTSEAWISAFSSHWHWQKSPSCWAAQGLVLLSSLPSASWLRHSPSESQSSSSIQADLHPIEETSQGIRTSPPSQLSPWGTGLLMIPFLSFFLLSYLVMCWCSGPFKSLKSSYGVQ